MIDVQADGTEEENGLVTSPPTIGNDAAEERGEVHPQRVEVSCLYLDIRVGNGKRR